MNALIDDLDLENLNPDDVEQKINLYGAVPKGKYHARLIEASNEVTNAGPVWRLKYQTLAKPYVGKTVEETLFLESSDPEKAETNKNKRIIRLHRLGVLKKEVVNGKNRYVPVPGKQDFRDVLGAECVIEVEVEEREFTYKQGAKAGQKGKITENKIVFGGVYTLDDPKVKDVKRGDSSAPPPAATKQADVNLDGI